MSLPTERLEQQRYVTNDRESVTQKDSSISAGLPAAQREGVVHLSKSDGVEEPAVRGTDGRVAASLAGGSEETKDSSAPKTNGNSQNNKSRRQDAARLSRRADSPVSGRRAAARPSVTVSGTDGRKKQFRSIAKRDRTRHAKRYAGTRPEPGGALRDGPIRASASDAENQSQNRYQRYNSGIFLKGQTQTRHHPRHHHARRRRRHRRRHHRYQSEADREGSIDGRNNAFFGRTQLSPPSEKRKSAKWRKNDQRNRRELVEPSLAAEDWRGALRRSYFGTLFWGINNLEGWQPPRPRPGPKKALKSEAGDVRFNADSEEAAAPPPGTKIRGSSGKESQKSSRFLRRRRSVSKFAQETKAKMKTKRQNLGAALSQRCGRTGAGLLRSCGEPEMNCKPGKGDPRRAEMVHGSCDGLGLAANQSSSAEQEPSAGKSRGPGSYVEQEEDAALVMVSDAGGDDGGAFQRRRRELGNLSRTPNVTYRCSPSHKYWLFASRWVDRASPEGEWTR